VSVSTQRYSERAVAVAGDMMDALYRDGLSAGAEDVLIAASDPALGPDASVCLRSICDWLKGRTGAYGGAFTSADDVREAIIREFGGNS
jgi:hypothetical protein